MQIEIILCLPFIFLNNIAITIKYGNWKKIEIFLKYFQFLEGNFMLLSNKYIARIWKGNGEVVKWKMRE